MKKPFSVIGIGDVHGRVIWKDIIKKESEANLFIFIGDYFDSREGYTSDQQIDNFRDIIEFKKQNINKVILLTGNHDFVYTKTCNGTYSGYQAARAIDLKFILSPIYN